MSPDDSFTVAAKRVDPYIHSDSRSAVFTKSRTPPAELERHVMTVIRAQAARAYREGAAWAGAS